MAVFFTFIGFFIFSKAVVELVKFIVGLFPTFYRLNIKYYPGKIWLIISLFVVSFFIFMFLKSRTLKSYKRIYLFVFSLFFIDFLITMNYIFREYSILHKDLSFYSFFFTEILILIVLLVCFYRVDFIVKISNRLKLNLKS